MRLAIVVLILAGITAAKDIFRYVDEETGQSHYMTGLAGKAVEGGFAFNTDGKEYALTYKADEGGFQPRADHIPVAVIETRVPVEDTNEVVEAKNKFYALFEEAKKRSEEAAAEAVKNVRKREAFRPNFFYRHKTALHDKYTYHPYFGYVPADAKEGEDMEEMKGKVYQYIPYKGFVATDAEDVQKPLFKFVPYRGFIPVTSEEEEESEDAKLYKFHPYYGYVPTDEEQPPEPEGPQFKFNPWHGFVPIGPEVETPEEKEFKYVPYRGFVPVDEETTWVDTEENEKLHPYFKKLKNMRYKFVPFQGFVPKLDDQTPTRKKRETDEEPTKLSYQFHPYFGLVPEYPEVKSIEDQEYKYVPYFGFVPHTDEDKDQDVKTYKFNPFYEFVDAKNEDMADTEMKHDDTLYKFVPYYGFVPVNNKVEEMADEDHETKDQLVFHPYYGYMPRLVTTNHEQEEQLYKLDPIRGFVPEPKEQEGDAKPVMEASRKKREAYYDQTQWLYHGVPYYPYVPLTYYNYYVPYFGVVPTTVVAQPTKVLTKPDMDLPDDFPVIPNEEGQNEQGALEF